SGLVLANCALLVIAGLVVRSTPALGRGALGLMCLPLLIRALGSRASAVTANSLRFQAGLSARQLFLGAAASHALMLLAGSLGATLWLIGTALTTAFLAAATLGILAGMSVRAFLSVEAQLLPRRVRDGWVSEASTLGALGLGLQRTTWWPLAILGACLAGAHAIGSNSPIAHGGVLGLLLAIATLLGPSALYLGESCFAAISENVHRIVGLRRGRFEPHARARSDEFGQLGLLFGHWGHIQSVLGGTAAALLTAVMLPSIPLASPLDGAIGMGHPIVVLGGLTGAASLLFHLGSALPISGRAVHVVRGDVGERLGDETVERAETAIVPSYRQSIQLAATAATQSLLRSSALVLLAPVLFGVVLRLVFGGGSGRLAAQGLMAFASTAALTGCSAALAAEGMALALRASRQHPPSHDRGPALDPRSARECAGRSIGSSALIGLKTAVIASLVIAPALF
ncbi:MAG TPA: sodium/proton-translocating pyrophosphatase, partial [Polyangiaceae bacterium]|nr:sodium/proton-translocating pyrophosphatase [Polyangiaceae bacterium]